MKTEREELYVEVGKTLIISLGRLGSIKITVSKIRAHKADFKIEEPRSIRHQRIQGLMMVFDTGDRDIEIFVVKIAQHSVRLSIILPEAFHYKVVDQGAISAT